MGLARGFLLIVVISLMAGLPRAVFATTYGGGRYGDGTYTNGSTSNNSSNSSSSNSSFLSSGCSASAPTKVPDLFQIDTGSTNATLYVASAGNYNKYLVMYGVNQNTAQYSAYIPVDASLWVIPIAINSLVPNTPYIFKIAAVNDCAPGPSSNTLSVKTTSNGKVVNKSYEATNLIQQTYSNVRSKVASQTTQPVRIRTPQHNNLTLAPTSAPNPQASPASSPKHLNWFERFINGIKSLFRF